MRRAAELSPPATAANQQRALKRSMAFSHSLTGMRKTAEQLVTSAFH